MSRVFGTDQLPHDDFSAPIGLGHGIEFSTRARFGIDYQLASEQRERLLIGEVRQAMEKIRIRQSIHKVPTSVLGRQAPLIA
jgi:hypothetical protein